MMNEEGSEVSSVTITKITLPLHDKILLNPKLIQEKMFHYFLLAHEKKMNKLKFAEFLCSWGSQELHELLTHEKI